MTELQQLETAPAASVAKHRRVIDEREAFEADSLEELVDKLADAKGHATKKIREQEAELRDWRAKGEKNETIENFVATHQDYENDERNAELMRMRLAELGLPLTTDNLHQAYSHLQQIGALTLRRGTDSRTEESRRTVEPAKVELVPQRTKKASGISTQSSRAVPPANTEPSLEDAYELPMDKLKLLANRQMGARGY